MSINKNGAVAVEAEILDSTVNADCDVVEVEGDVQTNKRAKLDIQNKADTDVDTEWIHIFDITLRISDKTLLFMVKS